MRLVAVDRIWDSGAHNAFTDLIRFRERWFSAFREGSTHVSPDGALRVIVSADGGHWESAARVASEDHDLRDPKLAIAPDGRLMLSAAAVPHDRSRYTHQSSVWFSGDGTAWSPRQDIGDPDFWLWRVTWHRQKAYAIGYHCREDRSVRLYRSDDGIRFEALVGRLFDQGFPNETSIVFRGDTAYCLLRRDGTPSSGLLGMAEPPYTEWTWKDLGVRIGGPHMLLLPDGHFAAAVRLYDGRIRTSLCRIDPERAKLVEILALPSGGDTSYAGLALHDDLLWVSYYSSHEGDTAIYLARAAFS